MNKIVRTYQKEEIDNMNYLFGKPANNNSFRKYELELCNLIDLFNKRLVNVCKIIWDNRENKDKLEEFLKQLN